MVVVSKKKCGLILILEANYNFTLKFRETLSQLHEIIFPLVKIPTTVFVNVVLCDRGKSMELNNNFCNKKKATDVLSWNYGAQKKGLEDFPFGEIVICDEICQKQALENNWDFEVEFTRLLVHGLAHLGGYQHQTLEQEKQMLSKEKEILRLCKLEFIYP